MGQFKLLFVACFLMCSCAYAQFTPRFNTNVTGDITLIGNTLLTCPTSNVNCSTAQANVGHANNDYAMVQVDTDSDPTTTNSSSATLSLPSGATVLSAWLYWGSYSNNTARNTVKFATPTTPYTTKTGALNTIGGTYEGYLNVTAEVQAGGNGTYWLGGAQVTTGSGYYGGWSLVVAYKDPAQPFRNLSIHDGLIGVSGTQTASTTISGFLTPAVGAVGARIGTIMYEGDGAYTGDSVRLNTTNLTDSQNATTNYANSSMSLLGTRFANKNPDYLNQLGFDADIVLANGIIPNGATSATITLTTNGDTYYAGAVTAAIDLYVPNLQADLVKTSSDINGGSLEPGDIIEYTIAVSNTGQDGATNVVLTDPIPANTTYVPNSIQVVSGVGSGAKTDTTADDTAYYDSTSKFVRYYLGTGATATAGGSMAPATAYVVKLRVAVNSNAYGVPVSNTAQIAYNSQTLGASFNETSTATNNTAVANPDLAIGKTAPSSGIQTQPISYTIKAWNNGPGTLLGSTISDTVPASITGVTWTCTPTGTATCATSSGSGNAISLQANLPADTGATTTADTNYITIAVSGTISGTGTITNTAAVAGPSSVAETNTTNNTSTVSTAVTPVANVEVIKTNNVNEVDAGGTTTYTITVTNAGPSSANGVVVTDTPSAGLSLTGVTCTASGGAVCPAASALTVTNLLAGLAIPTLPVGGQVVFTVSADVTATGL